VLYAVHNKKIVYICLVNIILLVFAVVKIWNNAQYVELRLMIMLGYINLDDFIDLYYDLN